MRAAAGCTDIIEARGPGSHWGVVLQGPSHKVLLKWSAHGTRQRQFDKRWSGGRSRVA
jgi:hypothetical protein